MAKVLIIEDDPYVRRFYGRLFKFKKYDVDMAENGADGITKAKANLPDLILLDIIMPVMNGLEVLEKLKHDPMTENCVVVMLTNLGDKDVVNKAMTLGAGGIIIKSNAPPESLLKIVDKYLAAK